MRSRAANHATMQNVAFTRWDPLRDMLARGLICSINTDDPGISAIDLRHEFEVAAPAAGLTREQIHQAQINALEAAFLSEQEKRELRERRQKTSNAQRRTSNVE